MNVPSDVCWKITWTDGNGDVVGTDEGNGLGNGTAPSTATNQSIEIVDCETVDLSGDPLAHGAFPFAFLKAPLLFDVTSTYTATRISATAISYANAASKAAVIEQGGPGTVLPTGVSVSGFFRVEVVGTDLVVKSSLPVRFRSYTITLDGVVIADKASNLNVSSTPDGNGWVTLTSIIPGSAAQPDAQLILTQTLQGEATPVVVDLLFL